MMQRSTKPDDRVYVREATEPWHVDERRLRALIEHCLDTVLLVDSEGIARYAGPSVESILGYTPDDLVGRDGFERIHPDDRAEVFAAFRTLVRQPGGRAVSTYRIRHCDGSWRWFETLACNLLDDPTVKAVIVNSRDITARKEAEDERNRAVEEACQRQAELAHVLRLHTMGEMAAVLAHEVTQPLTAITNYARGCERYLLAGTAEPEQLLGAVRAIAAQATRANDILGRLRAFVRKTEPHRQRRSLAALIEDALRFVAHEARERGVELTVELTPDLPELDVDPVQIEQVVLNLLRNGLEAIDERPGSPAALRVRAVRYDMEVEVTVADTGCGLGPQQADQVFEPFVTTKPAGLGMGLSICRSIIAGHGGRIWATPNPDRGTTFHFTLPVPPA